MYSVNAERNEASPKRMSLDKHSCRTELTQRSAKAFRFGLRGGRANGRTPLDCQYQFKIPHYSDRKFPSPRQVVVYSFGW